MTKPGYGTIDNPLSLADGLSDYRILSGHVVYLRGGTYPGTWLSQLHGTADDRITVMPYDNERVIISGNFSEHSSAQYIDYIDIEFTTPRDPNPAVYSGTDAHDFRSTGARYINCIFHDSNGAGAWDNVDLIYGCISYNHGYKLGGITPHGHTLYVQNQVADHKKIIKHSVFGRSANYGLHGYATNFPLTNLDIIENVLLPGSVHLIGSQQEDYNILVQGNHAYGVQVGYGAHEHADLTVTDNILFNPTGSAFAAIRWTSGSVDGNTIVCGVPGVSNTDLFTYVAPVSTSIAINNNTYYNRSGKSDCFVTDGVAPYWLSLATWQVMYGFDVDSTITIDGSAPADSVHVYPNDFAAVSKRKGMFVVWNWSGSSTVEVDLSTIAINPFTRYKIMQVQDPLNDIQTGSMPNDHKITVPMVAAGHSIASVDGWTDPPSTFPIFGAFIVELDV